MNYNFSMIYFFIDIDDDRIKMEISIIKLGFAIKSKITIQSYLSCPEAIFLQ